jgi:hypothetical protein
MEGEMEANGDKRTQELRHALAYAENIIATLREPFVVLDKSLRVRTANAAFYRDFQASKDETEGCLASADDIDHRGAEAAMKDGE